MKYTNEQRKLIDDVRAKFRVTERAAFVEQKVLLHMLRSDLYTSDEVRTQAGISFDADVAACDHEREAQRTISELREAPVHGDVIVDREIGTLTLVADLG